jgi:hypothetical protein
MVEFCDMHRFFQLTSLMKYEWNGPSFHITGNVEREENSIIIDSSEQHITT